MLASSSSPVRGDLFQGHKHRHRQHVFQSQLMLAPSSPTADYHDRGEISPSFDASFASSMSISTEAGNAPAPAGTASNSDLSEADTSADRMDISPAPPRPSLELHRADTMPERALPPSDRPHLTERSATAPTPAAYPFLKHLFRTGASSSSSSRSASTTENVSPRGTTRRFSSGSGSGAGQQPPSPIRHLRNHQFSFSSNLSASSSSSSLATFDSAYEDDEAAADESGQQTLIRPLPRGAKHERTYSERVRPALPTDWRPRLSTSTDSSSPFFAGSSLAARRCTEPVVPTIRSSSPERMEVDRPRPPLPPSNLRAVSDSYIDHSSPDGPALGGTDHSSASGRSEIFNDPLSPIPQSRKRFLAPEPSPAGPSGGVEDSPTAALAPPPPRRQFEKASTMNHLSFSRRRASREHLSSGPYGSSTLSALGGIRRPSLTSTLSLINTSGEKENASFLMMNSAAGETANKRAARSFNGKPMPKVMRRAYSVADAGAAVGGEGGVLGVKNLNIDSNGSPSSASGGSTPGLNLRGGKEGKTRSLVVGKSNAGSPLTGFRSQEEKGKALPCFGVKNDGLMRITPDTLNRLMEGEFADSVQDYQVVDCRFTYEHDGGHIVDAVNLPTTVDVEQYFLGRETLPVPSTSEDSAPPGGKTVLIFHCEFTAKRAPTSATHLRSKDRTMNLGCYPKVFYPEVYLLHGGYADFFKAFPSKCQGPHGYVSMDDPEHMHKRSVDLNAFRQQKRGFNRARSFTFGESAAATAKLQASAIANPSSRHSLRQPSASNSNPSRSGLLHCPTSFVFPAASSTLLNGAPLESSASHAIKEEEHETADSSFQTNTSGSSPACGSASGSPCPPISKVAPRKLDFLSVAPPARKLERAQTSSILWR